METVPPIIFLTTAKASMAGELQSSLRTVPTIPSKLELAFLNTTLCTSCNTAGVDEVCLQGEDGQNRQGAFR